MSDDMMPPQGLIESLAKDCRCCPECSNPPCDGLLAAGPCDQARCRCDDEPEAQEDDDWDPNACPGCGGNCQTACR